MITRIVIMIYTNTTMIFHHTAFKIRWKLMPNTPHHYYTWQPCAHGSQVSQSVCVLFGWKARELFNFLRDGYLFFRVSTPTKRQSGVVRDLKLP